MIKEVIVVEGKDDVAAVKAALECEVIVTGGFRIDSKLLATLRTIQKRSGLIILTDPDYAGKRIRDIIDRAVPGCKHAYIRRDRAMAGRDIGVENAKPEDIILAIERAKPEVVYKKEIFTLEDLFSHGLTGYPDSLKRRELLCDQLGIGYVNAKKLLKLLGSFGIEREEFDSAMEVVDELMREM